MTEHSHSHPDRSETGDRFQVSLRTELLRAAADGELSSVQGVQLDRHLAGHPSDARVIEFERALRASVAGTATGIAPGALRDRVVAMGVAAGRARVGLVLPSASARRDRRLSQLFRGLAMAASIAIVAGGANLILRPPSAGRADGVQITQQYRTSLVSFIGSQHEDCEVHADLIGVRFKTTKLVDVPVEFSRVLGSSPEIGHIEGGGFRLLGAGPCAVPGRGKSVRMVLQSTAGTEPNGGLGALVSIHIQQDTGELNLESGRTYRLVDKIATGGSAHAEIFVWRRGGFIYFLTSRSESSMQLARAAFGAKEPSGTL